MDSFPPPPPSINFCVLGRKETARGFGKAGTSSDITIYDRKARDAIRTWVVATGFPDRIQPLFQAINMSEYVIFHVDSLDRFAGEQIIALDALGKKDGMLCHTYGVDGDRLESMVRGTVAGGYARVGEAGLAGAVRATGPSAGAVRDGPPEVVIDHSFDVKGVGTVILGRVTSGMVRRYDKMALQPAGSEVLIKSIQMHDDPVEEAPCMARVGLAVKGVRPDEMQRGDILTAAGAAEPVMVGSDVTLENYRPNRFCRTGMAKGQGCMVSIGLQARAATITGIGESGGGDGGSGTLNLKFASPVTCHAGDTAVILRPEASPVRIAGAGSVVPA